MAQRFGIVMAALMSLFFSGLAVVTFHESHTGAVVLWVLALVLIAIVAFGAYDIGLNTKRSSGMIEPPEPWPEPPEMRDFKLPEVGDVKRRHIKWG